MTDTFGPAFPTTPESAEQLGCTFTHEDVGLTKLDWFAGQALAGMLVKEGLYNNFEEVAGRAYFYAEAMLIARERRK